MSAVEPMSNVEPHADSPRGAGRPKAEDLENRCSATSKQTQEQCRQPAIPGGHVCVYHGGSAAHVRKAAELRLLAGVDPALDHLFKLSTAAKSEMVKLQAIKDVLDRAGLGAAQKVEHDHTGSLDERTLKALEILNELAGKDVVDAEVVEELGPGE